MADQTIGAFSPADARMILDAARKITASGLVTSKAVPRKRSPMEPDPVYVANVSGEVIPAYACMQVRGTQEFGGQNYFLVGKPVDEIAEAGAYLFNLHSPIEIGGRGIAVSGVDARSLSEAPGAPSGTRLSARKLSWLVRQKTNGMFIAGGPDDIGQNVGRLFLYANDGSSGRIHFKTTEPIRDRQVNVAITHVQGLAIDPVTGDPLKIGDEIGVSDPLNKWPEIEKDATGIAFFRTEVEDDETTLDVDETREAFWQIEQCTLPIRRVKVKLQSCVLKNESSGHTVICKVNSAGEYVADGEEDEWKLSTYPNVDLPPEWEVEEGDGEKTRYKITVENPLKLDAVASSTEGSSTIYKEAIIERVTSRRESDPDNDTVPKSDGTSNEVIWQFVHMEEKIARHVKGTITGSSASAAVPQIWIDGGNPTTCDNQPTFDWFCDKPCDNGLQACFWATYDPERNKYWITSTDFALMGKPKLVELDPNLRITTDTGGNKALCVDKFKFLACDISDSGDSCVEIYECP